LFTRAFPNVVDPIQLENVVASIAAFTRTIVSGNSRYDQWMEGRIELTYLEEQGKELFFSEQLGCSKCHGGIFFDQPDAEMLNVDARHGYFNTGLYNIDGSGGYPIGSQGLIEITGDPHDMGAFRVPTLRNIQATYPWMHDGSEIDLRNIIRNYASGGRLVQTGLNTGDGRLNPYKSDMVQGFNITEDEIDAVLEFLHALNDDVLLTDERYASPFCIEQRGEIINAPCEPQVR
jgi:cytochrome c peroxidase